MRRPATFGAAFLGTLFLSVSPRAEAGEPAGASPLAQDVRFEVLAPEEKAIIDRIAADFFEKDLRPAQSRAIEEATSARYLRASPDEKAAIRAERRAEWRAMSEARKAPLARAATPRYDNLSTDQKAPFRRHAINRLGAARAIDEIALAEALAGDI